MVECIERTAAIKALCQKCTACSVLSDKEDKAWSKAHCAEIRALQTLPAGNAWISVKDRLPETEDHVLCCTQSKKGGQNIVRGYYRQDGIWVSGMNSNVTHWMPLPEPPVVGEE